MYNIRENAEKAAKKPWLAPGLFARSLYEGFKHGRHARIASQLLKYALFYRKWLEMMDSSDLDRFAVKPLEDMAQEIMDSEKFFPEWKLLYHYLKDYPKLVERSFTESFNEAFVREFNRRYQPITLNWDFLQNVPITRS